MRIQQDNLKSVEALEVTFSHGGQWLTSLSRLQEEEAHSAAFTSVDEPGII